jgi:tetratricopeptide (TPR) repeat protein
VLALGGQFLAGRPERWLNRGMEGPLETEGSQRSQPWDAEGMRASLSAVHAALAEARARNRRATTKARLLVGTAVVTFAVGLVATRTRAARKIPPRSPAVAATVSLAERPGPMLAESKVAAPISATRAAPLEMPASAASETSTTAGTANAGAVAECEMLCKRHRWRQAAEPCAVAIKTRPDDATILLGLAQSAHARNRLAEAGEWAKRASTLDPNLAEAFIIQAHAEARVGDAAAAARDFRRYLALAPRGWHAKEAREALRARQES